MDIVTPSQLLVTGLVLGVVHAFDADHVAALTAMGVKRSPVQSSEPQALFQPRRERSTLWNHCLHWSLGHGGVLMVLALLIVVMGTEIPQGLSATAETLVAYTLIALGIYGIVGAWRRAPGNGLSFTFAPWVGALHGLAGSAGVFILIPFSRIDLPFMALLYVAIFCLGVCLAMLALGSILGRSLRHVVALNSGYSALLFSLPGAVSIALGFYLIFLN